MTALLNESFRYYYLTYFLVAVMISLFVTPLFRILSFKLEALDRGEGRRVHEGVVPRLGGGGIYLAFLLPLGFALTRGEWGGTHVRIAGVLLGATVVFLIGAVDDLRGAPIRNKLAAEILAALVIYSFGVRIERLANPFNGNFELGWLSLPVTILWVVVITNAFNLIDGLDGLASGTGILIALALFFLMPGKDILLNLAFIVIIGSLLGFLRHNFPPATIFMGDSGSLLTGFILSALSIMSSFKAAAIATVMVPIIAFAHPLMDMIYAVLRRYHRGVSLGEADREHIHHKLLEMGLSRGKVLTILYVFNFLLLGGALFFLRRQRNIDLILLLALFAAAVLGLRALGYIEFKAFTRESMRNYRIGRRRRYFQYVIKKFRNGASQSRSEKELTQNLNQLMEDYRFNRAEVYVKSPEGERKFYEFAVSEPRSPFRIEFPVSRGEDVLGRVFLVKEVGEDYLLCSTELARALSESIGAFLTRSSE